MITEKQLRDALSGVDGYTEFVVGRLNAAGLISPEPDKPLIWNSGHTYITGTQTIDNDVLAAHQAALDEFAQEIVKVKELLRDPSCVTREGQIVSNALIAARKAGLTKVGA